MLARTRRDAPAELEIVPPGALHRAAQPQVRAQTEPVGAALQVVPDLRLPREGVRPVRVEGEGVRVQMRGHVAGAARVGVVTPGAADLAGLLEDDEIVAAGPLELDRRAEPREAGSDDRDVAAG